MKNLVSILSRLIFVSRWLQAPLYFGLVIALGLYVYVFFVDIKEILIHLQNLTETEVMMGVLDLIDVVMVANLLIMVILGGYEVFVSRLNLRLHPDEPEWMDEFDAGTMKVKLALALISISSIHLLRSFFDAAKLANTTLMWQVIIHCTLLISVLAIVITNKLIAKESDKKT
ncbi:MAG: transrane protein [Gammaproteobacteria bacterium]|jgi:uncharacterized protein (TIGR00645 family)|nr:transrane protein [Gammaproteobacteria bacterium]